MRSIPKSGAGFTLLELVMVILIVGIISVVAAPNWIGSESFGPEYESRRVLNDIRYTQAMSMSSGQRYRWVRTSSSTYQILNESGTAIMLPSGSTSVTLSSGVTFGSFSNLPNNLIAFDSVGAPYTTSTYPGTALSSTATIPVTSSSNTRNVLIAAQTGYGVVS